MPWTQFFDYNAILAGMASSGLATNLVASPSSSELFPSGSLVVPSPTPRMYHYGQNGDVINTVSMPGGIGTTNSAFTRVHPTPTVQATATGVQGTANGTIDGGFLSASSANLLFHENPLLSALNLSPFGVSSAYPPAPPNAGPNCFVATKQASVFTGNIPLIGSPPNAEVRPAMDLTIRTHKSPCKGDDGEICVCRNTQKVSIIMAPRRTQSHSSAQATRPLNLARTQSRPRTAPATGPVAKIMRGNRRAKVCNRFMTELNTTEFHRNMERIIAEELERPVTPPPQAEPTMLAPTVPNH